MNVIVFGATGMIGQGVVRECLLDLGMARVLTIGRSVTGQKHEKLTEIAQSDLTDYSRIAHELSGYDACFFCLGVSSVRMSEAAYRHVTRDIAVAAAKIVQARHSFSSRAQAATRPARAGRCGRVSKVRPRVQFWGYPSKAGTFSGPRS
jgi:uncharacterized protein YbjT (DUF2867 family)